MGYQLHWLRPFTFDDCLCLLHELDRLLYWELPIYFMYSRVAFPKTHSQRGCFSHKVTITPMCKGNQLTSLALLSAEKNENVAIIQWPRLQAEFGFSEWISNRVTNSTDSTRYQNLKLGLWLPQLSNSSEMSPALNVSLLQTSYHNLCKLQYVTWCAYWSQW